MSWAATTHHLMPCRNFEQAKKIWDDARSYPKMKAWGENRRPLESKRMPHKAIVKHSGVGLDAYSLQLYKTPLVTYHANGRVEVIYHGSNTSSKFFWRMKPEGVCYWGNRGLISVETPRGPEWYESENNTFTLEPAGLYQWEVTSATKQRMRTVTDRKRINQVNKALKGFMLWYEAVEKLTDHAPSTAQMYHTPPFSYELPEQFEFEQFAILLKCGKDIPGIKDALFNHFGARTREPIANNVRPLKRPRNWKDS